MIVRINKSPNKEPQFLKNTYILFIIMKSITISGIRIAKMKEQFKSNAWDKLHQDLEFAYIQVEILILDYLWCY